MGNSMIGTQQIERILHRLKATKEETALVLSDLAAGKQSFVKRLRVTFNPHSHKTSPTIALLPDPIPTPPVITTVEVVKEDIPVLDEPVE